MIYLDFEFNRTYQEEVNLVCCVTYDSDTASILKWWLHNNSDSKRDLSEYLRQELIVNGKTLCGFSTVAECRSLLSLGMLDVLLKLKVIDLYIEYRCISNGNHDYMYGKQLIDGAVVETFPPKKPWETTSDEELGFKQKFSLAEATYKLTNKIRDTEEKNEMRGLIISDPEEFSEEQQERILNYCMEDVVFLPTIYEKIKKVFNTKLKSKDIKLLPTDMLRRGRYSVITAIREAKGYGIAFEELKTFTSKIEVILEVCQREINELFPEIMPFKFDMKKQKYSWNQVVTKTWLKEKSGVDLSKWETTDGFIKAQRTYRSQKKEGKVVEGVNKLDFLSLSLEAFEKFYPFRHSFPKDNFGAQIVRYLKLKQSLSGFSNNTTKVRKFWDYVGPDLRVRPYMNIYGSSTGRSQPSANGFLFLKPAWVRSLSAPAKGKWMCGIDYGSEEFLISALGSPDTEQYDEKMVDAYLSGDVYLSYAKQIGRIPVDGKRKDYEKERDETKPIVLAMSYLMSKYGLAVKLSQDLGKVVSEDEAQEEIDTFFETYCVLEEMQNDTQQTYSDDQYLRLPCGWTLFGDVENFRSVVNFPSQGMGGSIMRRADELCFEAGLYIPFTLHDALYSEFDVGDLHSVDLQLSAMKEGFAHYYTGKKKEIAEKIRMDVFVWGEGIEEGELTTPAGVKVKCGPIYKDKRSLEEYEKFSTFFKKEEGIL